MRFSIILVACLLLCCATPSASPAQSTPALTVGAARIDITPGENELPPNFEGILDRLHARAVVLDNGQSRSALISLDIGGISEELWHAAADRLEAEFDIPPEHVMLTATHTHSAPFRPRPDLANLVVEVVRAADSDRRPARVGFGTGVSYINVNRNVIDPETRRWWEGPNYDGPSDKTVAVISFEDFNGETIAVYYNYAMHAVTVGQLDLISADAPGTTSTYIEESLDGDVVALWSSGAAGDQNPLYYQQTYDLRNIRIADYAARGIDISNSMPPGGQGLDKSDPTVTKLMNQQKQMIVSMGQFLGEEVLRVLRGIDRSTNAVSVRGAQASISCPGRNRLDSGRAGFPGQYEDADPVEIRLSLLMIGDIAIGGINAEVFNLIAQRFKSESPAAQVMMATLANGRASSGYIPNDAAYGMYTFEVVSSRLKPGCAEDSIVNGLLDLMSRI
ncbi:MAG TPA: hypothetical protein VKQ06_04530, partial [Gammaproteobacteria bacterium]|nr:hypothetical protein [Gammaproteobacteria bacterium]